MAQCIIIMDSMANGMDINNSKCGSHFHIELVTIFFLRTIR
jgi:hypothetical protein